MSVAACCYLSLHACNRSLFACGLSIDSRAYVINQHARWPIRTPHPICAKQDAWVAISPKRPKMSSIHTAAWHAWTRTPARNIVQKAVFPQYIFPPHPSLAKAPFWFGRSRHGCGLFLEQTFNERFLKRIIRGDRQVLCPNVVHAFLENKLESYSKISRSSPKRLILFSGNDRVLGKPVCSVSPNLVAIARVKSGMLLSLMQGVVKSLWECAHDDAISRTNTPAHPTKIHSIYRFYENTPPTAKHA